MSKIPKRNYVKKNMDKLHKPKTHMSDKLYSRKVKFKRPIPDTSQRSIVVMPEMIDLEEDND